MTRGAETPIAGFIGRIPVRNIWLLLLYASQLYRELPASRRVEMERAPDDIPYMVAEILANAVERRLRRSLSQGYQRRGADLNRVRGRVDLFRTERQRLLQRGRVACLFDELTVDTPRNRCVKAALTHIADVISELADHSDIGGRCRDLTFRLERAGVAGNLDSWHAGKASVLDNAGWVDAHERRMLAAAGLALSLSIPTEQSGAALLPLADRTETQGWKLYENAVAGFYDVALSRRGWKVRRGDRIQWPAENPSPGLRAIMPGMVTDIVLEHRELRSSGVDHRIVIDTKFTSIVEDGRFGQTALKSGHMYQLYAYLRSQEQPGEPVTLSSAGVLLYPSLGIDCNESVVIQGHRFSFATVDLAADSRTIRSRLLRVVDV